MNAVLFCRVSSREQEEVGYSLPSQQKLLTEYALKKEFSIARAFLVSESASGKRQRQAFNEMLAFIKKHNIKIIICEKTDRFTRNLKDAVVLYDWLDEDEERQLHLVKDNLILHKNSRSQEKLNLDFRIVFSKNYIDNLSEEVKKGQKEKLEQGWLPSKPKLGYKSLEVNGRIIHIIDEAKAPFVRKAFEAYAEGTYSLRRLTASLCEQGFRTNLNTKIVVSRLHALLSDPCYIGINVWNNKQYPAKHEPLISKELFQRTQARLKSKTTAKYQKHYFFFRGLVRCGECGGTITWERQKGIAYGHCTKYRPCSQKKWVKEIDLENNILFSLELLQIRNKRIQGWIQKALKESNNDAQLFQEQVVNELHIKLQAVNKRLSNLYDDKADGTITLDFYNQKKMEYIKDQTEIEEAVEKYNRAGVKYRELGLRFYEVSQQAKEIYLKKSPDKKRLLLAMIFQKLTVKNTVLEYEYTTAFKILAKLIQLTNESSKVDENRENYNSTFEPEEKTVKSTKLSNFGLLCSDVQGCSDSN
jgi:site-specific DNA recombinase